MSNDPDAINAAKDVHPLVPGGLVLAEAKDLLYVIVGEARQGHQLKLARPQSDDEMLHGNACHSLVEGATRQ